MGRFGRTGSGKQPGQYYQDILDFYNAGYGQFQELMGEVRPSSKEAMEYFRVGGGYGQGQKIQAKNLIQQGVARDTIGGVNTGMSSMSTARGLQTRAKSALATQYGNIEDTRAQLGLQANSAYISMMNSLSSMIQGYPKNYPVQPLSSGGGGGVTGTKGGDWGWETTPGQSTGYAEARDRLAARDAATVAAAAANRDASISRGGGAVYNVPASTGSATTTSPYSYSKPYSTAYAKQVASRATATATRSLYR